MTNYEELENWKCKVTFNTEYQVIFDAASGYLLTYNSNAKELSFALPIPKKKALELYKMKNLQVCAAPRPIEDGRKVNYCVLIDVIG
jgi:hypothetical protein